MEHPSISQLRKLVGVGNYQFGKGVGSVLFDGKLQVKCSKRTGRIRHIYIRGKLMATLRPKDGLLAFTPEGAGMVLSRFSEPPNLVVVDSSVRDAIRHGGDVFAKHVRRAERDLRPGEEVIIADEEGILLGVGSAVLSGHEMIVFKRGVAVNLRKGVDEASPAESDAS